MLTEKEIQEIEDTLMKRKYSKFAGLPNELKDRLSGITAVVLREWSYDILMSADIQDQILHITSHSTMTLDELEFAINNKPNRNISFKRYLKRMARLNKKVKKRDGKVARIKAKLK